MKTKRPFWIFTKILTGIVYSGMGPDFRVVVRRGQKQAEAYHRRYGVRASILTNANEYRRSIYVFENEKNEKIIIQERIPVLQLTRHVANVMQEFTQQGGVRPFGISVLIAGYDDDGPQLYQVCR